MAEICLRVTSKEERHLKKSDYASVYVIFLHFIYKTKLSITEHFLIHLEFAVIKQVGQMWYKRFSMSNKLHLSSHYDLLSILFYKNEIR